MDSGGTFDLAVFKNILGTLGALPENMIFTTLLLQLFKQTFIDIPCDNLHKNNSFRNLKSKIFEKGWNFTIVAKIDNKICKSMRTANH